MRSTDEDYGSLAYDGAPLLRVPLALAGLFLFEIVCSAGAAEFIIYN